MRFVPGILLSVGVSSALYADVVQEIEYENLDRVEEAAIEDSVLINRISHIQLMILIRVLRIYIKKISFLK